MLHTLRRFTAHAATVALLSLGAVAVQADSFASSASSAASKSVGSLSDSLTGSSTSSTGGPKVAEGTYRIERVAAVPGSDGKLRLELQATATPGEQGRASLTLPAEIVGAQQLAVAGTVELRHKPFGMEVARADTRTAFFLLLADGWKDDLESRAVTL